MSLINQALRKAQRDRTPKRMSTAGSGAPSSTMSASPGGMKPSVIIGLVVTIAILFGLVIGLSLVLFKGADPKTDVQGSPANSTQAQDQTLDPKPEGSKPNENTPGIEALAPAAQSSAEMPFLERETNEQLAAEFRKAKEAAEAEVARQARANGEASTSAEVEPIPEVINWLARAKINGVKLSRESGNKLILNGKSFAEGETVKSDYGLKVLIIQDRRILFIDENGQKYSKRVQ